MAWFKAIETFWTKHIVVFDLYRDNKSLIMILQYVRDTALLLSNEDVTFQTNRVSLWNGTAVPYVKWYPEYPQKIASSTCMGFETEIMLDAERQDMFNDNPSTKRRGVMCEK